MTAISKWSIEHMNHIMDHWNPIANNKKKAVKFYQYTAPAAITKNKCRKESVLNFEVQLILFDCLFDLRSMREWSSTKRYTIYTKSIKYIKKCASFNIRCKMAQCCCCFLFSTFHYARSYFFFSVIVYSCSMKIITNTNTRKKMEWCGEGDIEWSKDSV